MQFEIKSWLDNSVLFSLETESLKLCVEAAIKSGARLDRASLDGASLVGASLDGASLDGARLDGARLDRASLDRASLVGASLVGASLDRASLDRARGLKYFPIQIGGHKHWLCTTQDGDLQIGCHIHSFEKWREIAEELGVSQEYSPIDIEIYKLHIEHIERISKLLWKENAGAKTD